MSGKLSSTRTTYPLPLQDLDLVRLHSERDRVAAVHVGSYRSCQGPRGRSRRNRDGNGLVAPGIDRRHQRAVDALRYRQGSSFLSMEWHLLVTKHQEIDAT